MSVWESIAGLARLAPTPHNTQPFRIRPRGEASAEIVALTDRLLPREDHGNRYVASAFGIFAATLTRAARQFGRRITVTPVADLDPGALDTAGPRTVLGHATITGSCVPEPQRDLLDARRTSRVPYHDRPVDPAAIEALARVTAAGGHRLHTYDDPLNYVIESDTDRSLLITINRLENVSPRIRYNIHDRGIVRSTASVLGVLRDHGISIERTEPHVDLPLLFHWGRQDSSVGFYGCKITPEDIQNVILRLPTLASRAANFALHPYEDAEANKRLALWIELADGASAPDDASALNDAVWQELAAVNQDFRESITMVPVVRHPTLELFPFGESPISRQDIRIKKRYIV